MNLLPFSETWLHRLNTFGSLLKFSSVLLLLTQCSTYVKYGDEPRRSGWPSLIAPEELECRFIAGNDIMYITSSLRTRSDTTQRTWTHGHGVQDIMMGSSHRFRSHGDRVTVCKYISNGIKGVLPSQIFPMQEFDNRSRVHSSRMEQDESLSCVWYGM